MFKFYASFFALTIFCSSVFAEPQPREEIEYRKFKLERCACDVGVLYRETAKGADIGVSAIATGKGAEFRKWKITDIKLRIDDDRIKPDKSGKFYVKEESFFRIPAAILFAAIGTQIDVQGSSLEKGIAKAGVAIGLGLLVLQAQGEITGEKCVFNLDKEFSEKALNGKSFIEITLEDPEQHWQDTVKIGIVKPALKKDNENIYTNMSREELSKLIDDLGSRAADLEKEQGLYKYGVNPEYDRMQSEIEDLQTQRGIAYKVLFKKTQNDK